MSGSRVHIGTAAWTIPKEAAALFPSDGSHLERYSSRLNAVEINSSFYRDHKSETYARWAETVPEDFRYSVKLAKRFTHEARLEADPRELAKVIEGISRLGEKWGALLVQLPPSLQFDEDVASEFFAGVRESYAGPVALEPRHLTWTSGEAIALMSEFEVSKVIADPERCPLPEDLPEDLKEKVTSILYLRLHGSPEIYKSKYTATAIADAAVKLRHASRFRKEGWCIFDNTTFGHATFDALALAKSMGKAKRSDAEISPGL